MKWLLCSCLVVVLWCHVELLAVATSSKLRLLNNNQHDGHSTTIAMDKDRVREVLEERFRNKRAAGDHLPIIHGDYSFTNDNNIRAVIQYSGSDSPVIIVLTYSLSQARLPTNSKLYRSTDYGAHFTSILDQLDPTDTSPALWATFFISPINRNLVIIQHATQAKFYYSMDEGSTWSVRVISPSTINPRSLIWNPVNDRMAVAHDSQNSQLYVTQTLGATWIKIADNVESPTDYQWGDSTYDADASVVYFKTYDPADANREEFFLRTQRAPFNANTLTEFDPNLGRHNDFLLLGPYIFAQQTDDEGVVSLFVSYNRQPFQQAMIPSSDPHLTYLVSHIDEQQALVIVRHTSEQFNLYLSDLMGVRFVLSLPNIVFEEDFGVDLELIEGVNGTIMANQYVSGSTNTVRTLISLDNGGNWELVRGPATTTCLRPRCSLHFNMTNAYARTGIYSQASAPGIILAHGNTGSTLDSGDHNLFISRDGGVNWFQTLEGSWGVTVADHGGLLVAARDYRQTPSTELMYSCNEGISWSTFNFTTQSMTVYGVLTEPGEHTTTVSLYGVKVNTWDVVTVNFSSIFLRTCAGSDYYYWHPWDDRASENCLLGSSVTIERRVVATCCLIGKDYSRPAGFSVCPCFDEDFECDYGYMRAQGLTGECVRDHSVSLEDSSAVCGTGVATYMESQGYRKVAGDVCSSGIEDSLGPVTRSCCVSGVSTAPSGPTPAPSGPTPAPSGPTPAPSGPTPAPSSPAPSGPTPAPSSPAPSSANDSKSVPIGLIVVSVLLMIAVFCALLLAIVAAKMYHNLKQYRRGVSVGGIHYTRTSAEEEPLTLASDDHDDDDPLLT